MGWEANSGSGFSIRQPSCSKGRIRRRRGTKGNSGLKRSSGTGFSSCMSICAQVRCLVSLKTREREEEISSSVIFSDTDGALSRWKPQELCSKKSKTNPLSARINRHFQLVLQAQGTVSAVSTRLCSHAHIHHPSNPTCLSLLFTPGPPGAPGGVRVLNKTDKSVTLQWSRGADNHSPISKYTIQYLDSFSEDVWTTATTSESVQCSSWLNKHGTFLLSLVSRSFDSG